MSCLVLISPYNTHTCLPCFLKVIQFFLSNGFHYVLFRHVVPIHPHSAFPPPPVPLLWSPSSSSIAPLLLFYAMCVLCSLPLPLEPLPSPLMFSFLVLQHRHMLVLAKASCMTSVDQNYLLILREISVFKICSLLHSYFSSHWLEG